MTDTSNNQQLSNLTPVSTIGGFNPTQHGQLVLLEAEYSDHAETAEKVNKGSEAVSCDPEVQS